MQCSVRTVARCGQRSAVAQQQRRMKIVAQSAPVTAPPADKAAWVEQLRSAKAALAELIKKSSANPILVRLGWHDSGSYDKDAAGAWPKQGGATASIRFKPEIGYGCNAGLQGALDLIEPIKAAHPLVSYADLYQMASAVAIELAGGPKMPLRYGRLDAASAEDCTPDGRLPGAAPPFADGSASPADHLRRVFYRLGLDDKDIVVLSGAHTLGRARPERSGQGKESTKYTREGPNFPGGKPGGSSWTVDWLTFNNDYYVEVKAKRDSELLVMPTDAALFEDAAFRPHAEKYAADQAAFFEDYSEAHVRLSELGAKFADGTGVTL